MKAVIILLIVCALSACKQEINSRLLIGSWKAINNTGETGSNSYNSLTFSDNNSITAKSFTYGNLVSEISGKYKVDPNLRMLTTFYGDSITYHLEIIRLSQAELELYYPATKQRQKYSKLPF